LILNEFLLLIQAYLRNPDRQFAADTVNAIGRCAVRLPAVASSCVEGLLMLAKGAIINSDRIEEAANGEDNSNFSVHGDLRNSVTEKYSREAAVVAQAVLALRTIVQQHPAEQEEVGYFYILPGDALSGHQSLEWVGEVDALRICSPSFFF
jgi:AP-3 complex subunit beta